MQKDVQKIGAVIDGFDQVDQFRLRGSEPRRNYQKGSKPKKPLRARFKADFFFKDNNRAILYSLDYTTLDGQSVLNEWEGLNKFYRLIDQWEEQDKLHNVTIYANLDTHPLTATRHYNLIVHRLTPKIIRVDATIQNNIDGTLTITPLIKSLIKNRLNS